MPEPVTIQSVNVGTPQILCYKAGKPVYSSIAKQPVGDSHILLTYTNLLGDQQVDTKPKPNGEQLHGGNAKAVYVYPSEHFATWGEELGQDLGPGSFGENLTIAGILEDEACIGDVWSWGEATLQISKPRQPCFKLCAYRSVLDMIIRMRANGRCGWYMRVLTPGIVPTNGDLVLVSREDGATTVAQAFAEKVQKTKL